MNPFLLLKKGLFIVVLLICGGLNAESIDPPSRLEAASALKEKQELIRNQMLLISRQLNVTCAACHNVANFKSAEKPLFNIAKKHIELTQVLVDHGFNGREGAPKADCYMCHRGKQNPDYKEKIDPMTRLEKEKKSSEASSPQ